MNIDLRHVARVLVINDRGETYLLRGRDITPSITTPANTNPVNTNLAERAPFWFTPGGKIDPGETPAHAASRELWEEIGLTATPEQLGEIIGSELSDYYFHGQNYRQSGVFFAFFSNHAALNVAGWSEIEARTIDQGAWWSVADLRATTQTIYPAHLADMLATVLSKQKP